jgi:hypothetical protein
MNIDLRNLVLLTLVAASTAACARAPANPPAAVTNDSAPVQVGAKAEQGRAAGEYLVTLASGADAKVISDVYGRFGIKAVNAMGSGIFHLILSEDPGPAKMEEMRKQDDRIKAIQPNFVYRAY